eukprot:GHVT01039530.1.p2 GENE.GHVT01039530.1~~GHVT01039530.1.p2  ORF type:complete len:112 (+),score=7.49 GHVT01039530.1:1565-1900(+)
MDIANLNVHPAYILEEFSSGSSISALLPATILIRRLFAHLSFCGYSPLLTTPLEGARSRHEAGATEGNITRYSRAVVPFANQTLKCAFQLCAAVRHYTGISNSNTIDDTVV